MNARETTKNRELTSAELDRVSGGGVINTSALTLPKPPYPPVAK
jgi:hypothetical protein